MRVFSTDHKIIGLQYGLTSLAFLLLGFLLILLIRWQLAFPLEPIPLVGTLLGDANVSGGVMLPEFYNQADDVVDINRIRLPVGRPAVVQLSSKDVIHSFGIAAMRAHFRMRATVVVQSEAEFNQSLAALAAALT